MTLFLFMGRGGCFELRLSMPLSRHGDRIDGKHPLMRKKRLAAEVAFARQRAVFFDSSWFGRFSGGGDRASPPPHPASLPVSPSLSLSLARSPASLAAPESRHGASLPMDPSYTSKHSPRWESMPTSPSSFSTTAHRVVEPSALVGLEARMWLISDDLPAPRKPTTSVVGIFSASGRGIALCFELGRRGKLSQFPEKKQIL